MWIWIFVPDSISKLFLDLDEFLGEKHCACLIIRFSKDVLSVITSPKESLRRFERVCAPTYFNLCDLTSTDINIRENSLNLYCIASLSHGYYILIQLHWRDLQMCILILQ